MKRKVHFPSHFSQRELSPRISINEFPTTQQRDSSQSRKEIHVLRAIRINLINQFLGNGARVLDAPRKLRAECRPAPSCIVANSGAFHARLSRITGITLATELDAHRTSRYAPTRIIRLKNVHLKVHVTRQLHRRNTHTHSAASIEEVASLAGRFVTYVCIHVRARARG